jgi:hypothetical protein
MERFQRIKFKGAMRRRIEITAQQIKLGLGLMAIDSWIPGQPLKHARGLFEDFGIVEKKKAGTYHQTDAGRAELEKMVGKENLNGAKATLLAMAAIVPQLEDARKIAEPGKRHEAFDRLISEAEQPSVDRIRALKKALDISLKASAGGSSTTVTDRMTPAKQAIFESLGGLAGKSVIQRFHELNSRNTRDSQQ